MVPLSEADRALAAAGLVPDLSSEEVDLRLKKAVRIRAAGQRLLAFYLEEMDRRRLYLATSHCSTAFYAAEVLELEKRRTSELVTVGRKLRALPRIDAAFCEQQISWTKVMYLLEVATPEHEAAWLERALARTCASLRQEVRTSGPGDPPRRPGDGKGTPQPTFNLHTRVSAFLHKKLEAAQAKLSAECGHAATVPELLEEMADAYLNLEADGSVPGRRRVNASLFRIVLKPGQEFTPETPLELQTADGPLPVDATAVREEADVVVVEDTYPVRDDLGEEAGEESGEETGDASGAAQDGTLAPKTSAKLRELVINRDGGHCLCCRSPLDPHVHHLVYRSDGGPTRGANLGNLCIGCHGMVHEGLLFVVGSEAGSLRFQDRHGRTLNEPGQAVDPRVLMPLRREIPEAAAPEAMESASIPASLPTTLPASPSASLPTSLPVSLPGTVDGAWWRLHAARIRCLAGKGLVFDARAGASVAGEEAQPLDGESDEAKPRDARPVPADAFAGLVGVEDVIGRLRVRATGRAARGKPFPHTLFLGPAGTGKSTLARGIATLLGARLHTTAGPFVKDTLALVRMLAELREGDVLFLDEIHAVPREVLEVLYEAMSERSLALTFHVDGRVHFVRLVLPSFTLVGATTEGHKLPDALTSRFGLREILSHFETRDLAALVHAWARAEGVHLDAAGAECVAACSRGTPRIARNLLDLVLDQVRKGGAGRRAVARAQIEEALDALGYDADGLRDVDRRYLDFLAESRGPASIARIAHGLGLSVREVERDIEPFLLRQGRVVITARGRCLAPHRIDAERVKDRRLIESGQPDSMSRWARHMHVLLDDATRRARRVGQG